MDSKPKLLIVETDDNTRTEMASALANDFEVLTAKDRDSAVDAFKSNRPVLALLDLDFPQASGQTLDGLALLNDMVTLDRLAKVVVLTNKSDPETTRRAVEMGGAYDFLHKPVRIEELKLLLQRCYHVANLELEYYGLRAQLEQHSVEGMYGACRAMQDVFAAIRKVAATDAPVLLCGEKGTGKSMAALAIHRLSTRKSGPFVKINCTGRKHEEIETDMFGVEGSGGADTSAQAHGRIHEAVGGTLYISEVEELAFSIQGRLLHLLREHQIGRASGGKSVPPYPRVIAATSVDLAKAVSEMRFRNDLYYLLAVVVIRIPPLRNREKDTRLLAQVFLERFADEYQKPKLQFHPDALDALDGYAWPGNVRELENRVRRAVIMAEGGTTEVGLVCRGDLELPVDQPSHTALTLKDARRALEREMILAKLRKHYGNVSAVAAELGVSRATCYNIMARLGIERRAALKSSDNSTKS